MLVLESSAKPSLGCQIIIECLTPLLRAASILAQQMLLVTKKNVSRKMPSSKAPFWSGFSISTGIVDAFREGKDWGVCVCVCVCGGGGLQADC